MFHNASGLGQYSRAYVYEEMQSNPDHEFFLYTPKPGFHPLFNKAQIRTSPSRLYAYWRRKSIVNDLIRDNIDIYHGLSQEIPIGLGETKIFSRVTIHDMLAFSHKYLFPWPDRFIYQSKIKHAVDQADEIICVSEHTRHQLVSLLGKPKSNLLVKHPPLPLHILTPPSEAIEQKWRSTLPDSFLIYFGGYGPRKRVKLLIEALAQIKEDKTIYIVFAGTNKREIPVLKSLAQQLNVADQCLFKGFVPEDEVSSLYHLATAALYPSQAEGFGLPIIEARHMKIPLLCSDLPVFREAGGNYPIYLKPDPSEWSKAFQQFF